MKKLIPQFSLLMLLGLLSIVFLLPTWAFAQTEGQGSNANVYQESSQQQYVTPYQQETFQQDQLSYGTPTSRRPTFNNFYGAEERAYRSREEMRRDKEWELRRKSMELDLQQRQQQEQFFGQESSGLQEYGQGGGNPFEGFIEPQPPVIVDNQNNTQVIIQLGKVSQPSPNQTETDLTGITSSNVNVIQEGGRNNTLVDIQK